jgi:hypothetical protein
MQHVSGAATTNAVVVRSTSFLPILPVDENAAVLLFGQDVLSVVAVEFLSEASPAFVLLFLSYTSENLTKIYHSASE